MGALKYVEELHKKKQSDVLRFFAPGPVLRGKLYNSLVLHQVRGVFGRRGLEGLLPANHS